jgi:hypothetical protein
MGVFYLARREEFLPPLATIVAHHEEFYSS